MRHVLAAALAVLVTIVLLVGPGKIAGDFAATSGREATAGGAQLSVTGSGRAQFWSTALDAFAAEPLRGIGSGSFAFYWNRNGSLETPVRNAHSEPLELLAELGPLGLAAFVAFFAAVAIPGIRRARAPGGAAGRRGPRAHRHRARRDPDRLDLGHAGGRPADPRRRRRAEHPCARPRALRRRGRAGRHRFLRPFVARAGVRRRRAGRRRCDPGHLGRRRPRGGDEQARRERRRLAPPASSTTPRPRLAPPRPSSPGAPSRGCDWRRSSRPPAISRRRGSTPPGRSSSRPRIFAPGSLLPVSRASSATRRSWSHMPRRALSLAPLVIPRAALDSGVGLGPRVVISRSPGLCSVRMPVLWHSGNSAIGWELDAESHRY